MLFYRQHRIPFGIVKLFPNEGSFRQSHSMLPTDCTIEGDDLTHQLTQGQDCSACLFLVFFVVHQIHMQVPIPAVSEDADFDAVFFRNSSTD